MMNGTLDCGSRAFCVDHARHPLTLQQRAPIAPASKVVGKAQSTGNRSAGGQIDTLVIADAQLLKPVKLYAQFVLQMPGDVRNGKGIVWVKTWQEFAAALARYSAIDHLVLYVHANAGAVLLDSDLRDLGDLKLKLDAPPTVKTIDIEGCNVGLDPAAMVEFAHLLHAQTISAFNYFHVVNDMTIDVPKRGGSEEKIVSAIGAWKKFLLPNQPSPKDIAKRPGKQTLAFEWFRTDYDDTPPPKAFEYLPPRDLHARDGAEQVRLRASQGRLMAESDPVYPFRRITISVDEASEKAPDAGIALPH